MNEIDVSAAVKAASLINDTRKALFDKRARLIEERKRLQERVYHLYMLPVTRSEAKQVLLAEVDKTAKDFPLRANWQTIFERLANPVGLRPVHAADGTRMQKHSGPLNLADVEKVMAQPHQGGTSARFLLGLDDLSLTGAGNPALADGAMCFFFGDRIKERIEQHFDAMFPEFKHAGLKSESLTLAQRRAQIAEHKAAIEKIDAESEAVERSLVELVPAGIEPYPPAMALFR